MRNISKRLDQLEKDIESLSDKQNGEVLTRRIKEDGTFDDRLEYRFLSDRPLKIFIQSYGSFDPINQPIQ